MQSQLTPRTYSLVPDLPDFRDTPYCDSGPVLSAFPNEAGIDPRAPYLAPVKDQGQEGSCTAHAGTSLLETVGRKGGHAVPELSRQMYYYGERDYERTTQQDAGAQIRDGIKFAFKTGVCPESMWPYLPQNLSKRPPASCYAAAVTTRALRYARLGMKGRAHKASMQRDMLSCLASSIPFTFGISIYESFESDAVAASGEVPMPSGMEKLLGGHALFAYRYRTLPDGSIVVRFRNSWSDAWGLQGDGEIPLAYLLDPGLCSDVWAVLS